MNRTCITSGLLFICCVLLHDVNGQNQKSYIPPSPTAMAFQKFGDYPVDMSTGVPQIDIPLYTISLKDYSFPISASFHASGRSTSLNFSPLGMNWALAANGLISREVRGRVDDLGSSYVHLEKSPDDLVPHSQHYDEITSIDPENNTFNVKDTEYDIFTISISGLSAKFIKRDNGSIVFLNYSPYSVTYISGAFTVTDDAGNIYTFGNDGAGNGFSEVHSGGISYTSAWFIASITTVSGSVIQFKYSSQFIQPASFLGTRSYIDQIEIQDNDFINGYSINNGGYAGHLFYNYYSTNNVIRPTNTSSGDDYSIAYLKEIVFDNGKIDFSYTSTSANFLLDKCAVSNSSGEVIKNIQFDYFPRLPGTDLILQNNNSVTIKSIVFKDKNHTAVDRYSFDYYPGEYGGDQQSFAKKKDWWGYANGSLATGQIPKQIPFQTIAIEQAPPAGTYGYNTMSSAACKQPNFEAKLVGMVKAIHYPTGGTTVYSYEANKYANHAGDMVDGPGIRVKQIISYDGYGNHTGKEYKYSGGYLLRRPSEYDYFTAKKRLIIQDHVGAGDLSMDITVKVYQCFSAKFTTCKELLLVDVI